MSLIPAPLAALDPRGRSFGTAMALALLGTLAIAIAARVQVPMWPVPMTMQSFAVMGIGLLYGARLGAATVGLYLAQGALGLPVFAGGAGLAYLAGPTAGYLVGFVLAAGALGALAERGALRSRVGLGLGLAGATALIFVPGALWLAALVGPEASVASGILPFLPGALVKAALLALLYRAATARAARD
ncbi:biotin transporter BioY [Rhodovulum sp. 12E13]|uniref:biotin transporter BioY n=1 Tax=Rhodovulum sp. 12E13 TaxID=2203891 RepID=UPI000E11A478|nr:biotin transporter BioY [Rhodovulum sp. 12E13]RDC75319.1 biotin transporter BioY [Rhodovulum sp. 12E13]